jgi:hypothetical protein
MASDLVVLTTDLRAFLPTTAISQTTDIRDLTVRIDQALPSNEEEEDVEEMIHVLTHVGAGTRSLWTLLRNLQRVFQHMTGLKTFVFVVTWFRIGFWLPRDIMTDLVTAQPQQCCNLEIDK